MQVTFGYLLVRGIARLLASVPGECSIASSKYPALLINLFSNLVDTHQEVFSIPRQWLAAGAVVVSLLLLVVVSSVTWSTASAQGSGGTGGTGPGPVGATVELRDDLGLRPDVITLSPIGATESFTLHATGMGTDFTDTVRVLITHDIDVTAIVNVACVGEFDGAVTPSQPAPVNSGEGTAIVCFMADGADNDSGLIIEFDIERIDFGSDSVELSTDGQFGTAFFSNSQVTIPSVDGALDVLNLPEPTPTSAPPPPASTPVPPPPAPAIFPPGVPQDIEVESGDGTATIHWSPPSSSGGAPVTSYVASMLGNPTVQLLSGTSRSALFVNLENGVPVELRVRAVNVAGPGPYSMPSEVIPAAPPSVPRSVTASLLDDDVSITVEWVEPESDNGAEVMSYQISVVGGLVEPQFVEDDSTSVTFNDLPEGLYQFTVVATNSAGDSAPSDPTTVIQIGPAVIGAPGPSPSTGAALSAPGVELPQQTIDSLMQSIGDRASVNASSVTLTRTPTGVGLSLPVSVDSAIQTDQIDFDITTPELNLSVRSGVGTFDISVSTETTVRGSGTLVDEDGSLVLNVSRLWLRFEPELVLSPASPVSEIEFEVDLMDLPVGGALLAVPLLSFDEITVPQGDPDSLLASIFPTMERGTEDIALLVQVSLDQADEALFGNNNVTVEVDTGWLTAHNSVGSTVALVKISDEGLIYSSAPTCELINALSSVCSAVFADSAAGFSTFSLLAVPPTAQATPNPEVTATPVPAATSTPRPASTQTTPTSTPIAVTGPEGSQGAPSDLEPTVEIATPLPVPTPAPIELSGSSDNSAIVITIAFIVLFGGGAIIAVIFIRRRRKFDHFLP